MAKLETHQFPCRSDNYGVLLHDPQANVTAAVDAPETEAVRRALGERGWALTHIFTTHHHHDHTAGHLALKAETGCTIFGPAKEESRIPGIDRTLAEGDSLPWGRFTVRVLETPGHTLGHVSYWLPEAGIALVGDTLFSLGCGRLLEGTAPMMWESLQKIAALPPETLLYCGHEYTLANAEFALTIEPENAALRERADEVRTLRAAGRPTLPVRLSLELATNPFLRPASADIQRRLAMTGQPLATIFGEIRHRKDRFS